MNVPPSERYRLIIMEEVDAEENVTYLPKDASFSLNVTSFFLCLSSFVVFTLFLSTAFKLVSGMLEDDR